MSAFLVAAFATVGFSGAALLALLGRGASPALQSYATAAAAGILLALAFADLLRQQPSSDNTPTNVGAKKSPKPAGRRTRHFPARHARSAYTTDERGAKT